ncbi:MAG TPA: carboxypeptidase-like regulatory domain-containing protein [Methylomirabilota bacterium]|nr:carboxypeptidase-like regulatory domain-containing protein [Methylomirabilota bacterium]
MAGKCAALLAFLLVLVTAATALAEHEVYYRYTVLGYVKDVKGRPRPGVQVELVRVKTGFSYLGETDAGGLYVIIARLGDESAGEALRLSAIKQSVVISARFDPRDHLRERGTRVDFVGRKPVETPTAFAATLKQFLKQ